MVVGFFVYVHLSFYASGIKLWVPCSTGLAKFAKLNCGCPAVLAWLSLQMRSSQATPRFYLSRGQKSGELQGVGCQPTLASVANHVLQCYGAM